MIGIIGAMQAEVEALQQQMEQVTVSTISGVEFYRGVLRGQDVVVAQCGIGKVFAAICAQTMILTYHPDCLINTGVAGGLTTDLGVGDITVATTLVQHDMDTSPFGDPVGLISGINVVHFPADEAVSARLATAARSVNCRVKQGTIVSGDQFISDPAKKEQLHKGFDAVACEMEGAAIAHVCYVNKTPFAVLRAISDSASGDGAMEYTEFMKLAAECSTKTILAFCQEA
jgi:adenosylhomocysteine nucleosidase